jgi:hypothetical protein
MFQIFVSKLGSDEYARTVGPKIQMTPSLKYDHQIYNLKYEHLKHFIKSFTINSTKFDSRKQNCFNGMETNVTATETQEIVPNSFKFQITAPP